MPQAVQNPNADYPSHPGTSLTPFQIQVNRTNYQGCSEGHSDTAAGCSDTAAGRPDYSAKN